MRPRRFLLSRTDRLGDLILSTPVATALKQNFPQAEVHFLARPKVAEILRIHPHVDGVIEYEAGNSASNLAAQLCAYKCDVVLALFPRPQLAWTFYRAGIPVRIGTGFRWYSPLFTHRVFEHRKDARRHEAEYNLQLLRPLGLTPGPVEFHYHFSPLQDEQIRSKLAACGIPERFVVLHPGSGGSARDWPLESFAALAHYLDAECRLQVVLTGSSNEKPLAQFIRQRAQAKPIDLAGRLTLIELAALLRHAALFVSNSTGPLHLAVMMQTPVMAFYPPITACRPERWGPYGRHGDVMMSRTEECFDCRRTRERTCQCMRDIAVAAAIRKAEEKLSTCRVT